MTNNIFKTYVIVLGTADNKSLWERTAQAVREVQKTEDEYMQYLHDRRMDGFNDSINLSKESPVVMIFSGCSPEAENMRKIAKKLLRKDFPSDCLVLENTSRNTWENIVNSLGILKHYGKRLLWDEVMQVSVVSSAFHIPRVRMICDELFNTISDRFIFTTNKPDSPFDSKKRRSGPYCNVTCIPTEEPITEFREKREKILRDNLKKALLEPYSAPHSQEKYNYILT